jgi:hypothetical protein|uniref:Uncharacterized protein n=1 Tax=viral metagenome TaxID=1070528 RepID=A0A6C0DWS4_9ZZZZ
MDYYTVVTIIAVVLLVLLLTIIGIMMTSNKNNTSFPDYKSNCPDFWSESSPGVCTPPDTDINMPSDDKYLGANPLVRPNNTSAVAYTGRWIPPYPGATTPHANPTPTVANGKIASLRITDEVWLNECEKHKWAKRNGIMWDGVVNSNRC